MIEIDHLSKQFAQQTVVDDLSFSVRPGEVLGFLGPNGAGKSTSMKMLTGFLPPSSGSVRIMGFDIQAQTKKAQRHIGYLPEGAPCYGDMTVGAFLNFIACIRGFRGAEKKRRIRQAAAQLELFEVLGQSIDTLSKGFKRRVGLAQAILHDPKVLILDEPTDGLDPNQKHQVRELIQSLAHDKIVIISTHILEEVSALCSRALIIAKGRLLADDTPEGLRARSRYHHAVTLCGARAVEQAALEDLPGVATVEADDALGTNLCVLAQPGQHIFAPVHELLVKRGWAVDEIRVEQGRLDEVFRSLTRGEKQ